MMATPKDRGNVIAMSTIALVGLIMAMTFAAGIVMVGTPEESRATYMAYVGIVSMLTIFIVVLE